MSALVVGALLVPWDWLWILAGSHDMNALGLSHLVLGVWAWIIGPLGLKRILGVPIWLGLVFQVLAALMHMPVGMVLVRPPI